MDIMRPMYAVAEAPEKLETRWSNPNYVMELKLDGIREICYWDNKKNRLYGRRISVKTKLPVEKTDNIPSIRDAKVDIFQDCVFDGEIVSPGTLLRKVSDFDYVQSVMGSKPERATNIQNERGNLEYIVFDLLVIRGEDITSKPFKERRQLLQRLFNRARVEGQLPSNVKLNPQFNGSEQLKRTIARKFFDVGAEGVILKDINAVYQQDKRPANVWVKVKKIDTEDVIVIGYEPATVEYTGKDISTWLYWQLPNGNKIRVAEEDGKRFKTSVQAFLPDGATPISRFHYNGWIGALRFGQWVSDTEENRKTYSKLIIAEDEKHKKILIDFGECSGITDEQRIEYSNNKVKYLGKVFEIEYMERFPTGRFRHPRFYRWRPDKSPVDCTYDD